jgi:hypothetical protein
MQLKTTLQNETIQYLYHELPEKAKREVVAQIFDSNALTDEFFALLDTKKKLAERLTTTEALEPMLKPKQRTIDSILAFSRNYQPNNDTDTVSR